MDREQVRARIREIQWYHNWELLPGIMTNGWGLMSERLPHYQIPQDLRGKRVLDVGCADGYFTFLAESRGAEVVSIDSSPSEGYSLAHELLNSRAEFRHMSVYDVGPSNLGMFDIVFFFGVYYHLKHPLLALERIASVTREFALIESEVMELPLPAGVAASRFFEFAELNNDPTNWWAPNIPCLLQTIRASGFPRAELIGRFSPGARAVARAEKGPRTTGKALGENLSLIIDTPLPGSHVTGAITISGWTLNVLSPDDGIDRITVYLDRADDPGFALGKARYRVPRPDLAPRVNSIYGDVGFEFEWDIGDVTAGQHTLYVLVEGGSSWQYAPIPIIVGPPAEVMTGAPAEKRSTIPQETAHTQQVISKQDAEIARLRALVDGYERGRFIRFAKWLHGLRRGMWS